MSEPLTGLGTDWNIPTAYGVELCRQLRQEYINWSGGSYYHVRDRHFIIGDNGGELMTEFARRQMRA